MFRSRIPLTLIVVGVLAALPSAAGAARSVATTPTTPGPKVDPTNSSLLWATVNACNPADTPGAVGIRGSMPGDGDATQHMFMRLQVQFQGPKGAWRLFPGTVGDSGFVPMGSAKQKKHQAGQTFSVVTPGQTATLRGLVTYQWRAADGTIVRAARRITAAGHVSSAGADPAGFSAATCVI
jgi:hypothetical protein